jgi:hypothetical protein
MLDADTFITIRILSRFAGSGAYCRSQWVDWRRQRAAALKEENRVRLLYLVKTSPPPDSVGARDALDRADSSGIDKGFSAARQASFV